MDKCGELNLLCIGELMAGKSTFLQSYTQAQPSEEHFKIFLRRERGRVVWLHEMQEKMGVDVYLKYQFDAVLFFVKIDHFHNTSRNLLEWLSTYSQASGTNVFKIPLRLVVLSSKRGQLYDDIGYEDRRRLQQEVTPLLAHHQIIYVESDLAYISHLAQFYSQVEEEGADGIRETIYACWCLRDWWNLFSIDQFKLQLMRLMEEAKQSLVVGMKLTPHKKWPAFI